MEKKEGFFKKFLKWLSTPEIEAVKDGEINIDAFREESHEVMQELKSTSKSINDMANVMFVSRAKHREETLNRVKAKVETPKNYEPEVHEGEKENEHEQ